MIRCFSKFKKASGISEEAQMVLSFTPEQMERAYPDLPFETVQGIMNMTPQQVERFIQKHPPRVFEPDNILPLPSFAFRKLAMAMP